MRLAGVPWYGLGKLVAGRAKDHAELSTQCFGIDRQRRRHDAIMRAIETVLVDGPRTPDLGGKASTQDVGKAVVAAI